MKAATIIITSSRFNFVVDWCFWIPKSEKLGEWGGGDLNLIIIGMGIGTNFSSYTCICFTVRILCTYY